MNRILLIEDNEFSRMVISEFLASENFEVIAAKNGTVGLQFAIENAPDLILCDINMPMGNGFDVLKQLRENLKTIHIPLVFLTAEPGIDRDLAIALGANGCLKKPVDLETLRAEIASYFEFNSETHNDAKESKR